MAVQRQHCTQFRVLSAQNCWIQCWQFQLYKKSVSPFFLSRISLAQETHAWSAEMLAQCEFHHRMCRPDRERTASQRYENQSAPKERRRRRAGERLSKRVLFGESRFFSAPVRFALKTSENLKWEEKKRTLQNTLLDERFSARRLLRSFGAPPEKRAKKNLNDLFRLR